MSPLQWVRETGKDNAEEAGATKLLDGTEMQALDARKVHRRLIADNGKGMSPEESVAFINKFGGGGKPIGGEHVELWHRSEVRPPAMEPLRGDRALLPRGRVALVHLHFDEKSERYRPEAPPFQKTGTAK